MRGATEISRADRPGARAEISPRSRLLDPIAPLEHEDRRGVERAVHVRVELEVGAEHVTADRKDVQLSWGVGVGD